MKQTVGLLDGEPSQDAAAPVSGGDLAMAAGNPAMNAILEDVLGRGAKRCLDIIGALILIALTLPVMIAAAIAIKLTSRGPILFSRLDDGTPCRRVGRDGQLFAHYKFRTMVPNSHALRYTELAEKNVRSDGPLVKIQNDPRVTQVGRFLRRASIDELPEFFKVLWGDMSLVGPRPHLPEEVARYRPWQMESLLMKPGITGLAQVSGRAELPFDTESRLNVAYVRHWSLWLDIKILLKTPLVVLTGRGAS